MSSQTHVGRDQQCRCRPLTPLLQSMVSDGLPAVPPGKMGDVDVGDTIAEYPWRFRGQESSGSPGFLVQGGGLSSCQGDLG